MALATVQLLDFSVQNSVIFRRITREIARQLKVHVRLQTQLV